VLSLSRPIGRFILSCSLFEVSTLAFTVSTVTPDSGAGDSFLSDANALTYAAIASGGVTVGGAAFVAAVVVPGHVVAGTLVTGTLLAGSECKRRTGDFLPFLSKKDKTQDAAPAAA